MPGVEHRRLVPSLATPCVVFCLPFYSQVVVVLLGSVEVAVRGSELSCQRISLTCANLLCLLYLWRHLCGYQG